MHFEHLGWGLQITALGMGLVFGLLALLWALLVLALRLDRAPAAPAAATVRPADASVPTAAAAGNAEGGKAGDEAGDEAGDLGSDRIEPALLAAIAAALRLHRGADRRGGAGATPEERVHWPGSLLHASRWVAAGRGRQTRNWQRRR
jgi:hypothetical protein